MGSDEGQSAARTAREVRAGERSAVSVTQAYLARIAQVDGDAGGAPGVRAFLHVDVEGALARASALDDALARARAAGATGDELAARYPLAGVPTAVKDVLVTRGLPTTCASRILEGYVPPYDAHTVERLHASGAIMVGKANMDEFAMGSSTENSGYFSTRNPWDRTRTPGGSSGGSAAAVAAKMSLLALGTDTGGSVRQPAALTGVVGLKPTYGRVSRYGLIAFASSFDVVGPLATNVEDTARLYEVIAGHDPRDSTSVDRPLERASFERGVDALRGLRVGVPREYFADGMEPEVGARVREALAKMADAGAELVELSMPHTQYGIAAYYVLAPAEASSNLARFDGVRYGVRREGAGASLDAMYGETRDKGFGREVKRRIVLGTFALSEGYYEAFYGKAQKVRTLIRRDFSEAFAKVDLIATPTSPTVAFALGARNDDPVSMYLADVCTLPPSLAGVPAVSLPCGLGAQGLPVGLQLVAPAFEEARLLAAAHAVEALMPKVTLPA